MIWALTTVSFRYHLHGFADVLELARQSGFRALELWEPHFKRCPDAILAGLRSPRALPVAAFSGYQDLTDFSAGNADWERELQTKLGHCQRVGARVLRLFSGTLTSVAADGADWQRWFERLDAIDVHAARTGIDVVFETHPGTLLDGVDGVERFLQACRDRAWRRVGLNFDVFHVWEFGVDPLDSLRAWYPHVRHVHLKNARCRTGQFAFGNVYHPMGQYDDLAPICDGVVDVPSIVAWLHDAGYAGAATLEHFGPTSIDYFRDEIARLERCMREPRPALTAKIP